MRKKTGILLIIVLVLLIAVLGVYFAIAAHYNTHFFRNTTVNGTDVSEMTAKEAEEALQKQAKSYRLVITGLDDEQETIPGEAFDYHYAFDGEMDELLSMQDYVFWFPEYLSGSHALKSGTPAVYDEEQLDQAVAALSCMNEEETIPPKNAYVDKLEDGTYGIFKETPGTQVDPEKMDAAVKTAVTAGRKSLNLETAGCYATAEITADNETLRTRRDLMNQYAAMVINYYMGGDEVVSLTGSTFMDWFSLSKKNKPKFDYDAVAAWVNALADTYDTIGTMEPFVTSKGQTISVEAVAYGWQMDREAEAEALYELLLAGQTEGRSPIWRYTADTRGENDVGDTYVEIDYTNQRMWYYKDGELLVETPVVTGNVNAGNGSPEGMYFVYYKETNAILEGEGYKTPVNYWMPFFDNVGIHDADSWRSSYGGTIYLSSGSHGCINTPFVMAEKIYGNMEDGTPVICYYSGVDYGYSIQSIAEIEAEAAAADDAETEAAQDISSFNDYTTETNNISDTGSSEGSSSDTGSTENTDGTNAAADAAGVTDTNDSGINIYFSDSYSEGDTGSGAENGNAGDGSSTDSAGESDEMFDIVISDETIWTDGASSDAGTSSDTGTDAGIVIIN